MKKSMIYGLSAAAVIVLLAAGGFTWYKLKGSKDAGQGKKGGGDDKKDGDHRSQSGEPTSSKSGSGSRRDSDNEQPGQLVEDPVATFKGYMPNLKIADELTQEMLNDPGFVAAMTKFVNFVENGSEMDLTKRDESGYKKFLVFIGCDEAELKKKPRSKKDLLKLCVDNKKRDTKARRSSRVVKKTTK